MTMTKTGQHAVEFTAPSAATNAEDITIRVSIGRGYTAYLTLSSPDKRRLTAKLTPTAILQLLDALTGAYEQSAENLGEIIGRLEYERAAVAAVEPGTLSERVRAASAQFDEALGSEDAA